MATDLFVDELEVGVVERLDHLCRNRGTPFEPHTPLKIEDGGPKAAIFQRGTLPKYYLNCPGSSNFQECVKSKKVWQIMNHEPQMLSQIAGG